MMKPTGVFWAGLLALTLPIWSLEVKAPAGSFHLRERAAQGVRWVCAEELARALKGNTSKDPVSAYPVLTVQGKRILVSTASPMVSVEGRIVRLGRAAQEAEGCLWLPEEFLTSVLPLVLGGAVTVGSAPKEAAPPPPPPPHAGQVTVDLLVGSDLVKVSLSGAGAPQAQVSRKGREVEVRLLSGAFSAPARDLGKGIVERVAPDQEGRLLRIRLGERFGSLDTVKKDEPPGLVLLLKGQAQELPAAPAPAPPAPSPAAPSPPPPAEEPAAQPQAYPAKTPEVDVVAIDPGHGGSDTGALGSGGVAEKDLTLALGKKLGALLESRGFRVVLTRSTDSAVPLKQRAALANFNQADLFLSIHMNASPVPGARGPEVYFMSHEATDLWSKDLAEKENAAGNGLAPGGGGLDLVLWEMAQTAHLVESSFLAETIQNALNGLMGTDRRAVRQAPFAVLEGATMPAVLVEVAFLTNAEESRKLGDPAFQDRVAERLAGAVAAFKERYENPPAPAPGE